MSGRLALTQLRDQYFTTHGSALEEALSTSVAECMNARPDDPTRFIGTRLLLKQ